MKFNRTDIRGKLYRPLSVLIFLCIIPVVIALGVVLWNDRRYNVVSVILVAAACLPFFFMYERKHSTTREMVILAVLVAFAVVGRVAFMPMPFFKPMTAFVVIAAIYLGSEAGFLVGALSAVFSNMFFGQGPWTPFQIFSWGIIGWIAGLPAMRVMLLKARTQIDPELRRLLSKRRKIKLFIINKLPLIFYGAFAGILFSVLMDIWGVLNAGQGFVWRLYLFMLATSMPVTIIYMVSNVFFLLLFIDPIGKRLDRVKKLYGINTLDSVEYG